MSRFPFPDEAEQGGFNYEDDEPHEPPTCNRCGTPDLEWVDTGGRPARWRLYEGQRLHVCKQISQATADDFEALP